MISGPSAKWASDMETPGFGMEVQPQSVVRARMRNRMRMEMLIIHPHEYSPTPSAWEQRVRSQRDWKRRNEAWMAFHEPSHRPTMRNSTLTGSWLQCALFGFEPYKYFDPLNLGRAARGVAAHLRWSGAFGGDQLDDVSVEVFNDCSTAPLGIGWGRNHYGSDL